MINRNLGTMERLLRLAGAVLLSGWLLARGSHDILSVVAGIAALAFLANAIFSRCYLWALLGINSCDPEDKHCGAPPQGS